MERSKRNIIATIRITLDDEKDAEMGKVQQRLDLRNPKHSGLAGLHSSSITVAEGLGFGKCELFLS